MTADALSSVYNLGILDTLSEASISEILESWNDFCLITGSTVNNGDDDDVNISSSYSKFESHVYSLCKYGLQSLVEQHFLLSLQVLHSATFGGCLWFRLSAYCYLFAYNLLVVVWIL